MAGCQPDLLTQAEEMIESYDFETAIELLDSLDTVPENNTRLRLLRAKAHLVSGDRGFAFSQLQNLDGNYSKFSYLIANILLESANIISREKVRAQEVVDLLDSAIIHDVGLKDEILSLAWARGMEYIDLVGDAGLRYFAFSQRHDPRVIGRLRGFNPQFARRFEELSRVDQMVQRLNLELESFIDKNGYKPQDISELAAKNRLNDSSFARKGWDICLEMDLDRLRIVARANSKCPYDIPYSSRVYFH